MSRSLGIFLLGLLIGGLAGYALRGRGEPDSQRETSARPFASQAAADRSHHRAPPDARRDEQKILLGDIAAMPFQELYETLSRQPSAEIVRLAQQLDRLPPDPQSQAKIKAFFTAWAHLDAMAAFHAAKESRNSESRALAISATIAGADPEALEGISKAIIQLPAGALPGPSRDNFLAQAIEKWSESDPVAAAHLLSASKIQGLGKSGAFYSVAQNWAKQDPAAALAWAQEQPIVPFGLNPVSAAVSGWWTKDPEAAQSYALAQIGTPLGRQLVSNIASQMANKDRDAAAAWVARIGDSKVRQQAYAGLAAQLAFSDPKTAGDWALTLPEEALAGAISTTAGIWAQSNPSEAGQWIDGLSGKVRDAAVNSYAYAVAETDPAAAMAWAATISEQSKRENVTRHAMDQWMERDPAAARAWVQSSSLGEAEKTKLLATPSPSP